MLTHKNGDLRSRRELNILDLARPVERKSELGNETVSVVSYQTNFIIIYFPQNSLVNKANQSKASTIFCALLIADFYYRGHCTFEII